MNLARVSASAKKNGEASPRQRAGGSRSDSPQTRGTCMPSWATSPGLERPGRPPRTRSGARKRKETDRRRESRGAKDTPLKPNREMGSCPVRELLDEAAAEACGFTKEEVSQWREAVAAEPTIKGRNDAPVDRDREGPARRIQA